MGGYFEDGRVITGEAPMLKQYVYNVGLALSQLVSCLIGGDPDESICSRSARGSLAGYPLARYFFEPLLNGIMGSPDHCRNSMEPDEDFKKEIWSWK